MAIRALQFAAVLRLNVPVRAPVEEVVELSLAARELVVSCSASV